MFKDIWKVFAVLFFVCSFTSCSKDRDGAIATYCYAKINGVAYKDYDSIFDIFSPEMPTKPELFYGDRLGVYNDSIFIFQFLFSSAQSRKRVNVFGAFALPKGKKFPILNRPIKLLKNPEFDKNRTVFEDFLRFLPATNNNDDCVGIAIVIDGDKLLPTTSIDGSIIFNKFDNGTHKLYGNLYLNSNGKLPIPYQLEGQFSDELIYRKVKLQ